MVVVPLYDTLGPEALVFIIDRGNWSFSLLLMLLMTGAGSESSNSLVPEGIFLSSVRLSLLLFITPPPPLPSLLQSVLHFAFQYLDDSLEDLNLVLLL